MNVGFTDDDYASVPYGSVDLRRLVDTYPVWRRPFTWLAWHVPGVRWVMGKMFRQNPYRRVVAVLPLSHAVRQRGKRT